MFERRNHRFLENLPNGYRATHVPDWKEFLKSKTDTTCNSESFIRPGLISANFFIPSYTDVANPCVGASFIFSENDGSAGTLHSYGPFLPDIFCVMVENEMINGGVAGGGEEAYQRNRQIFNKANIIFIPPIGEKKYFATFTDPRNRLIYYSYQDLS